MRLFRPIYMSNQNPKPSDVLSSNHRLSIRLDLATGAKISPLNIAVLEEIARVGSISAAGRALRLSYRHTWKLVEELNQSLDTPLVETAIGGCRGGGAALTPAGKAVLTSYRAIETDAALAAQKHLLALSRACSRKSG
jgi:molybdate transport system regulatory protein